MLHILQFSLCKHEWIFINDDHILSKKCKTDAKEEEKC